MEALALALARSNGAPTTATAAAATTEMSPTEAKDLCTTLQSMASTIKDSLSKRLQGQLGEPGGGDRSLDKSGEQIQAEALQLCCIMTGRGGDAEAGRRLIADMRKHDGVPEVATFLDYWSRLSLIAGVVAPGAGREVRTNWSDWYRGPPGQARYMPSLPELRAEHGLEGFVLQGWTPHAPLIRADDMVTALGSCFADEIRIWLRARGYRVNDDFRSGRSYPHVEDTTVPLLQCSAGLVNTFVLLQQFEWALEGRAFSDDIWVGAKGQIVLPTEAARLKTRQMFAATRVFVITLGLAEVWFQRTRRRRRPSEDGEDGEAPKEEVEEWEEVEEVLWRAVPSDRFEPKRHGFRVSSVEENLRNLRRLVRLVRKHVPGASVVFTLSPVPLNATFRGVSCVTANAVSKSILRVAVDELMRENGVGLHHQPPPPPHADADADTDAGGGAGGDADAGLGGLYYWPAYEMVKEAFAQPYLDDGRHPRPEVVQRILQLFGKHYCVPQDQALDATDEAAAA